MTGASPAWRDQDRQRSATPVHGARCGRHCELHQERSEAPLPRPSVYW